MMAHLLNQADFAYEEKNHTFHISEDCRSKQDISNLLHKHSKGRIRDNRNDKWLFAKFNMKSDTAIVAQKLRPVAYYLQAQVNEWLE